MIISKSSRRRLPVAGRVVEVEEGTPWYPVGTHNKLPLNSSSSIGEGELGATRMAIRGWKGSLSLGFKISRASMNEHSNCVCTALLLALRKASTKPAPGRRALDPGKVHSGHADPKL